MARRHRDRSRRAASTSVLMDLQEFFLRVDLETWLHALDYDSDQAGTSTASCPHGPTMRWVMHRWTGIQSSRYAHRRSPESTSILNSCMSASGVHASEITSETPNSKKRRKKYRTKAPGGGRPMFSTLASTLFRDCHFGLLPQTVYFLRFSGGDDAARTRDLRRDSEPENWNLLKQCVAEGPF
jgi:hypothetical protein